MLINYIPTGRANAITRQELVRLTGMTDRAIRREIKKLNQEGIPILSSSRGCGYWLSDDTAEIEAYIKEIDSRRKSLYLSSAALRNELNRRKGIKTVTVREHQRRVGA